ncbi:MAG: hypothetical protein M1837_000484 [Sclerophora amabilis]|nr:MAG: hypothetical protein M1837_000484 [Sclerophora amabilis]
MASSSEQLKAITVLRNSHGCRTERQGDIFVKSGPAVEYAEITALQLIAQRLDIPVPHIYDALTGPDGNISISMDFVDGETLSDIWPCLIEEQKLAIAQQLRAILIAMRSLEPDQDTIGSCGGGPAIDLRRYSAYRGGPFLDEGGLNDFLISDVFAATPSILVRKFRQRLRTDHRVVFTHADLAQHNIIIRDNKIVALVDWQYAGWYPEYWDYIKFFARPARNKDWYEYADVIFPQSYDEELFQFQFLARYQNP